MTDFINQNHPAANNTDSVRLDRWLWASRFYKTRQLAAAALKSGHIELNGRKAKPAKSVRRGDWLMIRKDQFRFHLEVIELREKRVGAELAAQMYRESEQSLKLRQERLDQQAMQRLAVRYEGGRPSKKDRRSLSRFKRQDY